MQQAQGSPWCFERFWSCIYYILTKDHVIQFRELLYTGEIQKFDEKSIIHLLDICLLLEITNLIHYCMKLIQKELTVKNFVSLYKLFVNNVCCSSLYDSDINVDVLRKVFGYFYGLNKDEIKLLEKYLKITLFIGIGIV